MSSNSITYGLGWGKCALIMEVKDRNTYKPNQSTKYEYYDCRNLTCLDLPVSVKCSNSLCSLTKHNVLKPLIVLANYCTQVTTCPWQSFFEYCHRISPVCTKCMKLHHKGQTEIPNLKQLLNCLRTPDFDDLDGGLMHQVTFQ